MPTITSLSPSSATAGGSAFLLTVNGTGFLNSSVVNWNGSARTTSYVNATQVTASISAADIASAGTAQVTVFNPTPGGGTSTAASFTINTAKLTITTTSLPNGTANTFYSFQILATGGKAPLTWSITGLPATFNYDSSTGIISGTTRSAAKFTVSISVTDSSSPQQNASTSLSLTIVPAPLVITTTGLDNALINTYYSLQVQASGGTSPIMWSATGLPSSLSIDPSSGYITGTPLIADVGTYTVTITATDSAQPTPQIAKAVLTLNVTLPMGVGVLSVTDATIGQNLQVPINITFNPAPSVDITLTITSNSPGLVMLGNLGAGGSMQLTTTVPAGTSTVATYAKAMMNSGTATITASAPSYIAGNGTMTLANSGFVVSGPAGIGGAFTVSQGAVSTLTVYPAQLDSSGNFHQSQQLRGGYSISVPVNSSDTGVGTLSASSVSFSGGADSATVSFTAKGPGNTTVTVNSPYPFVFPSLGGTITATVIPPTLMPPSGVTVGKNLQISGSISLSAKASADVLVTIHSSDISRLKFANTSTGTGSDTITVTIPQNQTNSPDFYIRGYDSSGAIPFTVSANGYGTVNTTMPLGPSGLAICQNPYDDIACGASYLSTLGGPDADLYIFTALLNGSGSFVTRQTLAPEFSISAAVNSSNTSVGTITASPVTIVTTDSGNPYGYTQFHAAGAGNTTITASADGYTSGSVNAAVQLPRMVVTDGVTVGQFLQEQGSVVLPNKAPAGGLDVTVQANSGGLQFAVGAGDAGSSSLLLHFTEGQTVFYFYIHAMGSSGTASFTATAAGYAPSSGTITLVPSGVVIQGPGSVTRPGTLTLTIYTAQLSGDGLNTPVIPEALAGGGSLIVSLHNSDPTIGSVSSSVIISPGTNNSTTLFVPLAAGSTTVSLDQPTGWTTPSQLTTLNIKVQ